MERRGKGWKVCEDHKGIRLTVGRGWEGDGHRGFKGREDM